MTAFGKSVRIYLKDGTVTGIKFGEVVNQTIQSISCPRNRINELSTYLESKRPGLYFLFGMDEETMNMKAYIGEAESVIDRLQNHVANKDFWSEVIFFVSKDDNLTKAHVKYLESRIIQAANKTKRYKIENSNQSQASSLPMADKDAMEEFSIYIKLLLGILGHRLLEDVAPTKIKESIESFADQIQSNRLVDTTPNTELLLITKGLRASALQTDEGIVVLEGSEAAKDYTDNLQIGYRELRENLVNDGTLQLQNSKYVFQKNQLFPSASSAAAVIVGYNINGRAHWKDINGTSLKEIEERKIE